MDISAIYTDYYQKQATDAANKKLSSDLKKTDLSGSTDEELMDVCKQFEAYFVEQVLKQAMNTFTEGDEYSSGSMSALTDYFKDNLMQEYSKTISDQQNLGLAQMLYEQMKRNYSPSNIIEAADKEEVASTDATQDTTSATEAVSTTITQE